jgi:hypothetical protein
VAKEKADRRPEISLSSYLECPGEARDVEAEFWEILDKQIIQAFDEFARQQSQMGIDSGFFAGEAVKGFKLLDILMRRYDIIVTNPPYLDSQDCNPILKSFLESEYQDSKRNLYSAFVERCFELLLAGGRLGILTGQSFMFISSFEDFRKTCLEKSVIESLMQHGYGLFESRVDTAAYVLRREPDAPRRGVAMGTYIRLVKEPDSERKRLRFEQALDRMRAIKPDPSVSRYRQADFDAIPGSPWVYWITPEMRRLFLVLPKLGEIAQPRQGLATADNFRFLRFWWEVGSMRMAFGCRCLEEAQASGKRWFPHMKGGNFQKWWGNQENVIALDKPNYDILKTVGNKLPSRQFYFQHGLTYSAITSKGFTVREMPVGFVFDHGGNCLFTNNESNLIPLLGILNSKFTTNALKMLNPTVNFYTWDLERLPIISTFDEYFNSIVEETLQLAKVSDCEDEISFNIIIPPWSGSIKDTLRNLEMRSQKLISLERDIDEMVYRLYDICEEDRRAIESEQAQPVAEGEETEEVKPDSVDDHELARRWISYAVGIVMGRFQPGVSGALGHGRFSEEVAAELRSLTDSDGIATLDKGHEDDLALKVWNALAIALGESGASEVVSTVLGDGNPKSLLRHYLERDFWKRHLQQYRKRPVYWLFQSPAKSFSVYVFHERSNRDTLPIIMGTRYVSGKINQLKNRTDEVRNDMKTAEGSAKKLLEKNLDDLETKLLDLEAFEAAIRRVLEQKDERGETVGWTPELDDGVILNLAPLRELMPSWKEPELFWQDLEEGKYDWSYTAMRYWPDRVLEKCKTNKSYAIAHDRLEIYEGGQ